MKVDCFSGSWRQKVPRHEVSEAIERESPTIFFKKVFSMSRLISLRLDARRLL